MTGMVSTGTALLAVVGALPVGAVGGALVLTVLARPPRSTRRPPRSRHYRGAHR